MTILLQITSSAICLASHAARARLDARPSTSTEGRGNEAPTYANSVNCVNCRIRIGGCDLPTLSSFSTVFARGPRRGSNFARIQHVRNSWCLGRRSPFRTWFSDGCLEGADEERGICEYECPMWGGEESQPEMHTALSWWQGRKMLRTIHCISTVHGQVARAELSRPGSIVPLAERVAGALAAGTINTASQSSVNQCSLSMPYFWRRASTSVSPALSITTSAFAAFERRGQLSSAAVLRCRLTLRWGFYDRDSPAEQLSQLPGPRPASHLPSKLVISHLVLWWMPRLWRSTSPLPFTRPHRRDPGCLTARTWCTLRSWRSARRWAWACPGRWGETRSVRAAPRRRSRHRPRWWRDRHPPRRRSARGKVQSSARQRSEGAMVGQQRGGAGRWCCADVSRSPRIQHR